MTKAQIATLGKLSAECPHCNQVAALSSFAKHYGERAGLAMIECKCGCGGKWRRVEVGK